MARVKRRALLLGLALLAITVAAYWPAMQSGGFVWDDDDYVTENRALHSLRGLRHIWSSPGAVPQYYPLVHTTFWLEYRLWGLNATGYHVTNVLLHAVGAILLWRLLLRLGLPVAWVCAAMFALHPVHVESVAWITERKNVLSGACYFGAALTYLRWVGWSPTIREPDTGRRICRKLYFLSLLLFLGALLSKTVTATLPAALLLVTWWKRGRIRLRDLFPLLPMFAAGLALGAFTVWMEKHSVGAVGQEFSLSLGERLLVAGRVPWFYALKLLWPAKLTFIYPRWDISVSMWWQWLFPAATVGVLIGLWFDRRRLGRGPLAAVLFFLGTLFPALGFFDVYPMRYSFVADHFQYLASVGILVLVAEGMGSLRSLIGGRMNSVVSASARARGKWLFVATCPLVAFCLVMFVLTFRQSRTYEGLETLWKDTIRRNPDCWLAHNNLGWVYHHSRRNALAEQHLRRALALKPDYVECYANLATLRHAEGDTDEAIRLLTAALSKDPGSSQANYNMGVMLESRGNNRTAEQHYWRALAASSSNAKAHNNLANLLETKGRSEVALRHYRLAVRHDPDYADAHGNLGALLYKRGKTAEGLHHCQRAVYLDPTSAAARNNLAFVLRREGRFVEAERYYREALRLVTERRADLVAAGRRPPASLTAAQVAILAGYGELQSDVGELGEAEACFRRALSLGGQRVNIFVGLGDVLLKKGRPAAAVRLYERVVQLAPGSPAGYFGLGAIALSTGEESKGEGLIRKALALDPAHAGAHNYLGALLAKSGDLTGAAAHLRAALRVQPGYVEAARNLSMVRELQARAVTAIEEARREVAAKPGDAGPRKKLALMLSGAGEAGEALTLLKEVVALDPDDKESLVNCAILAAVLGQGEDAETHVRKALEVDPEYVPALTGLGDFLRQTGRAGEAAGLYDRALALDTNSTVACFGRGALYSDAGESQQAVSLLRRTLELDPRHAQAHNCLAGELVRIGDLDNAVVHLRTALQLDPRYEKARRNLEAVRHMQQNRRERAEANLERARRPVESASPPDTGAVGAGESQRR